SLARNYNGLGTVLSEAGRPREAEVVLRKALEAYEATVAGQPTNPDHACGLGGCYCNLGNAVLDRPGVALALFDRAVSTLKAVLRATPRDPMAQLFLRNSHWSRARVLVQLGRTAEAESDWGQALALSPEADRVRINAERADFTIHELTAEARGGD